MNFSIEELINFTEIWLIKGDLNPTILADNFQFISPFWESNSRADFIDKFQNSSDYKDKSLSKITKFDPIIKCISGDLRHFSIIVQYYTNNGSSIYEALLGTVADGLLVELRSIYDLEATKRALDL